ncbi:MAG: hypothetical protein RL556_9 [Actinomycetota bacterium]
MPKRARLTPAVANTRRLVRAALHNLDAGELVLVACSGGADSLALAAAAAFEATSKNGVAVRVGGVIIEHGLQAETAQVAAETKIKLEGLGLSPVIIAAVKVGKVGGVEAAARTARYQAIERVAHETGASAVMLGHTLNDQAETVMLGLARGSGARSLSAMTAESGLYRRPFLSLSRAETEQACLDQGMEFWNDPHNVNERYMRVRVRRNVLPVLEEQMGPGIIDALARTADQAREDETALAELALQAFDEIGKIKGTSIEISATDFKNLPLAVRHRITILVIEKLRAPALARVHVLAVDELVDAWHGQKSLTLPGVRVERIENEIIFKTTKSFSPGAC